MRTVHVNEASLRQLRVLLRLDTASALRVAKARPFRESPQLHRVLPGTALPPALLLSKRSINQATVEELIQAADVSPAVAQAIHQQRPYYSLLDLNEIEGVDADAFSRLSEIFYAPELAYQDKLSGRPIELTQNPSELAVLAPQLESASFRTATRRIGLSVKHEAKASGWLILASSDSERGRRPFMELKRRLPGQPVLPSFLVNGKEKRYLDVRYCSVQFDPALSSEQVTSIVEQCGLKVHRRLRSRGLYILNISAATSDPDQLTEGLHALNRRNEVRFAEPCFLGFDDFPPPTSRPRTRMRMRNETESGSGSGSGSGQPSWHLSEIHAAAAHAYTSGLPSVVVAVIDSGIDLNHPSLKHAIAPQQGENWNFDSESDPVPSDVNGHGTFVAGMLVGNGLLDVYGVSPGIRLLPLKVPTTASIEAYAQRRDAILYALEQTKAEQRLIINISWKTSGDIALIRDAIAQAHARGALVVASAGNWAESPDEAHFPSDYETVISVGALGRGGHTTPYSLLGHAVDLVAPGGSGTAAPESDNLLSSFPDDVVATDFGTSFAAPQVAGVAALIWSVHPQLSADDVRTILTTTAREIQLGTLSVGMLDAAAAVAKAAELSGPRLLSPHGLDLLNQSTHAELMSRFGLLAITARLLIARRPITHVDQLLGIPGLTPEQLVALCHAVGMTPTLPTDPAPLAAPLAPVDVNTASFEELMRIPEMPTITARILLIRRPFQQLADVMAIVGMTKAIAQYLRI